MPLFPNLHYKPVSDSGEWLAPLSSAQLSSSCFSPSIRRDGGGERIGRQGGSASLLCQTFVMPPLVNALKLHAFRIQGRNSRETAARCCSPNYTESLFFGRATRERKRNYGIRFVGGKREESGKLCRDTVGVSWIRNIYFNPIRCVLCSFGSPVTI